MSEQDNQLASNFRKIPNRKERRQISFRVNDDEDNLKYAKVFFEDGAFRLYNTYFELNNYKNLEVVGNIYENTELLGEG